MTFLRARDGTEYDGCERCEGEFSEDESNGMSAGPRATEGYHKPYNLDLCQECASSFRSWIRCKCC